jgi:hypothetical protein
MRASITRLVLTLALGTIAGSLGLAHEGVSEDRTGVAVESLSADPQGWASNPTVSLAPDGTVYVAMAQHTAPPGWQLSGISVKRWSNGRWDALEGRIGHTRGQDGAQNASAYAPSLAVVGHTPYVAWYEGGGYGWGKIENTHISASIFVAHWGGGQWVLDRDPRMPNGALNSAPDAAARTPKLAVVGGRLFAAWVETRRIRGGGGFNVVVIKQLLDGQWQAAGGDLWDGDKPVPARIVDFAAADVAGILHVAWTEHRRGGDPQSTRVNVARLHGTDWVKGRGVLNVASDGYANHVAMTALHGEPYVAWQEHSLNGNERIFVKVLRDGRWVDTGGPLSMDPAGEAGRPALAATGSEVWLAWAEAPRGQRALLRVRTLGRGGWAAAGAPLNVAASTGAADSPALAAADGRVVVAWAEKTPPPATKQVYARALQ